MLYIEHYGRAACAVVKAACLEVGDRGFEPHSGLRYLKKQNVSSLLTCNDSILLRASVTKR